MGPISWKVPIDKAVQIHSAPAELELEEVGRTVSHGQGKPLKYPQWLLPKAPTILTLMMANCNRIDFSPKNCHETPFSKQPGVLGVGCATQEGRDSSFQRPPPMPMPTLADIWVLVDSSGFKKSLFGKSCWIRLWKPVSEPAKIDTHLTDDSAIKVTFIEVAVLRIFSSRQSVGGVCRYPVGD
ncbi:hypothetical protein HYFRA_00008765 [Hymenoscyphus fraxineus]|uniref:Uncharacterized protein n=1 Tax=Hymenoscyphus fraxineus TaxID=746836 RepID=A0A9N9PVT5_9HELO|nr:hypothetical protein HYFRA_00008765 [Hymenoscyphus fraxineus]